MFKNPKNIRNISSKLAYFIVDIEDEVAKEAFSDEEKLINANKERLGTFTRYSKSFLHDSEVLRSEVSATGYVLLVNDFTTHVFADAIVETKGVHIPHEELVFPLELEFNDFSEFSSYTIDLSGALVEAEPDQLDEYLYDEILEIGEEISMGIILWKKSKKRGGDYVLILLKAKEINVKEMQRKAWTKCFGNSYDDYYNYFLSELEKGRYLSGITKCIELIGEFDKKKLST
jgi:adenine-specific DNA methylase